MSKIRAITQADYTTLAHFLAHFPDDMQDDEASWQHHFDYWWDANPYTGSYPRGWLLLDGERIVGMLGQFMTPFQVERSEILATNMTTWYVLPEHRPESLRLLFTLLSAAKDTVVFNTTPSGDVAPVLSGLRFELFPGTPQLKTSVFMPNPSRALAGHLSCNFRVVAGWAVKGWQMLWQLRRRPRTDLVVHKVGIEQIDDAFDDLWHRTHHMYANTNVRTSQYLRWYCNHTTSPKTLIACFRGSLLVGYMVLAKNKPVSQSAPLVTECVDIWEDPKTPDVVEELVGYALDYTVVQGLDIIMFPHPVSAIGERYQRATPLTTKRWGGRQQLYRCVHTSASMLRDEDCFLTSAQGDRYT